MIKRILLVLSLGMVVVALLWAAVVYASPTATLQVTVVPVQVGGNVACDSGPSYQGPVPQPAQLAGFTHCALNADFTTSTTDGQGTNFANINTFVSNCGAPDAAGWARPSFTQYWWGVTSPQPGCGNDISVVTDPVYGVQALHLQYLTTDQANGCAAAGRSAATDNSNCADFMQWEWPHGFDNQGTPALPIETYTEITYRVSPTTLNQYNGAIESFDFWKNRPFAETDFIEVSDGCYNCGGSLQTSWRSNWGGNGYVDWGSIGQYVDFTQYVTLGFLMTYDGNGTNATQCWLVNTSPGTPMDFTKWLGCGAGNYNNAGSNLAYDDGLMELDVGGATGLTGIGGPSNGCGISPQEGPGYPNCVMNNEDFYIQSIRVWECSNYQSSTCIGPMIGEGPSS